MTENFFIKTRSRDWEEFESLLYSGGSYFSAAAPGFPEKLREISSDLNTAKAHGFNPLLVERLNRLVLDARQKMSARGGVSLKDLLEFIAASFPRAVRRRFVSFAACAALFYGAALFFGLLTVFHPSSAARTLGYKSMADIDLMYDPEGDFYLKPRKITEDADMFGFYIYNNISITFKTFAGGVFAGLGSLVFLIFNAVFLGSAAGYVINRGFAQTFFSFVSGHSAFELTGIILGAQAGLLLGLSFFVTKGRARAASMREAAKDALPLLIGGALLDFLAAIIEAFWSSKHQIPPEVHYGAGIAMWLLLSTYFLFAGRRRDFRFRISVGLI